MAAVVEPATIDFCLAPGPGPIFICIHSGRAGFGGWPGGHVTGEGTK